MFTRRSGRLWSILLTENGSFTRLTPLKQEVRWKSKLHKFKPDIVPVSMLKPYERISGSIEIDDTTKSRKFLWDAESLNARGFLRFQKEFKPPADAMNKVISITRSAVASLAKSDEKKLLNYTFEDTKTKFELLSKMFTEFDHSIPNSMLYMINSVEDAVKFYSTPIKTTTPYDELVKQKDELPPNLHVQKDAVRFHPETDTLFGGVSAFPKSSNIVQGLRAKKKYKGFEAKKSWP